MVAWSKKKPFVERGVPQILLVEIEEKTPLNIPKNEQRGRNREEAVIIGVNGNNRERIVKLKIDVK